MSEPNFDNKINFFIVAKVKEYFLEENEDKCWPWLGNIAPNGYPRIKIDKIIYKAHRVVTLWHAGLTQSPLYALHNCNNPICMNYLKHLYLGTAKNNTDDCIKAGNHDSFNRKGEKHPMAKLTEPDILYIRQEAFNGRTHQDIANEFNVERSLITQIVNKKLWKHI